MRGPVPPKQAVAVEAQTWPAEMLAQEQLWLDGRRACAGSEREMLGKAAGQHRAPTKGQCRRPGRYASLAFLPELVSHAESSIHESESRLDGSAGRRIGKETPA